MYSEQDYWEQKIFTNSQTSPKCQILQCSKKLLKKRAQELLFRLYRLQLACLILKLLPVQLKNWLSYQNYIYWLIYIYTYIFGWMSFSKSTLHQMLPVSFWWIFDQTCFHRSFKLVGFLIETLFLIIVSIWLRSELWDAHSKKLIVCFILLVLSIQKPVLMWVWDHYHVGTPKYVHVSTVYLMILDEVKEFGVGPLHYLLFVMYQYCWQQKSPRG